ncbi:MAG: hypothetical protein QF662_05235, partial [Phycisphaerae bacterium]|nr:hypothetical protein [Phycisphaerae bacterium]
KTQLLARLSKDFDVTGAIFADTIRAVSLEDKLPESIIGEDSFSTDLGGAIDKVVSGWGKTTQTAAVIVISDGSWNRGSDPVAPARSLGSRSIPIYAVASVIIKK